MPASPIIIETGEPVLAIGGWGGADPIVTVEEFAALVAQGQIRYVLVPEFGEGAGGGVGVTSARNAEVVRWAKQHGTPVDPALWRPASDPADDASGGFAPPGGAAVSRNGPAVGRAWRGMGGAMQLYDCRPSAPDGAVRERDHGSAGFS